MEDDLEEKFLDHLYETILTSNDKEFFVELKRYVDQIVSEIKYKILKKRLDKEYEEDLKEYKDSSNKVLNGCKKIKDELEKISDDNNNVGENLFIKFDDYLNGKIQSSELLADNLIEVLEDLIETFQRSNINIPENFIQTIKEINKDYLDKKNEFERKKSESYWNSLNNLLQLKLLDTDISKLKLWEKANIGLFKKEIEDVKSGRTKLPNEKREKYISSLKKIHFFYKNLKFKYGDDLRARTDKFKEIIWEKGKINSIPHTIEIFNKEFKFAAGLFFLTYALFFGYIFFLIFRLDLISSIQRLGIPNIDFGLYWAMIAIFFFVILTIFMVKLYFKNVKEIRTFFDRFLNGYILLAIGLISISLLVGFKILTFDYGSTLPQNFDIKDYTNEGFENFTKDNIQEISLIECNGEKLNRFFIQDSGAICRFSLKMKNNSEYYLNIVKEFVNTEHGSLSEINNMRQDIEDHWVWINHNQTGDFKAFMHFHFKSKSTNKTMIPYSVEYEDSSLSFNEYKDLEDRKNVLIFTLFSVVIFSILSAVVNIKKLTEDKEK